MDSRSKGLIATIAAVVLCGCPGLVMCIMGAAFAAGVPLTTELNGVSNTTQVPVWAALAVLCLALIFILIPVAVGFFTLRPKPTPPVRAAETLPPAS